MPSEVILAKPEYNYRRDTFRAILAKDARSMWVSGGTEYLERDESNACEAEENGFCREEGELEVLKDVRILEP
jgi:hypothetical protein